MSPPDPTVTEAIEHLRDRVAALERALRHQPPPGWEPSNYTCTDRPELTLCRDCVTGRWSVWGSGRLAAEGASPTEAVEALNARPGRSA